MTGTITVSGANRSIRVVWKIDKFLSIQDVAINSPTFLHGVRQFHLRIYPKGDKWFEGLNPEVLSMSLIRHHSFTSIEYIMGIRKCDSSEYRKVKSISILNPGAVSTPDHELISRSDLKNNRDAMVPGGTLTVFCNIRFAEEKLLENVNVKSLPSSTYGPSSTYDGVPKLIENFKDLYLNQRFTDVKIRVKNKEFLAHKVILCARSEVFAAMFELDTAEKRSGVVTITDSDPESFEYFLLYLYTGKLNIVSSLNAASLYKTADKYGLKNLKIECIQCMIKGMSVDSFCDIFHLAIMHNESDLLSGATKFFILNANVIMTKKKWLALLEEHSSLCNDLLLKFSKRGIQK